MVYECVRDRFYDSLHQYSKCSEYTVANHMNNDSTTKTQTHHSTKLANVKNRMRSNATNCLLVCVSLCVCLIRKEIQMHHKSRMELRCQLNHVIVHQTGWGWLVKGSNWGVRNGFFHGLNRAICVVLVDCCLKHTIPFRVVFFLK